MDHEADDDYWWGVRIDFDEMEKSDTFRVPALTQGEGSQAREIGTEPRSSSRNLTRNVPDTCDPRAG